LDFVPSFRSLVLALVVVTKPYLIAFHANRPFGFLYSWESLELNLVKRVINAVELLLIL